MCIGSNHSLIVNGDGMGCSSTAISGADTDRSGFYFLHTGRTPHCE